MKIIGFILGLMGIGRGNTPAQAAGTAGINIATLALLAPVFWWLVKHQDAPALIFTLEPWIKVTLSWGQFSFMCLIIAGVIKLAQRLPPPPPIGSGIPPTWNGQ